MGNVSHRLLSVSSHGGVRANKATSSLISIGINSLATALFTKSRKKSPIASKVSRFVERLTGLNNSSAASLSPVCAAVKKALQIDSISAMSPSRDSTFDSGNAAPPAPIHGAPTSTNRHRQQNSRFVSTRRTSPLGQQQSVDSLSPGRLLPAKSCLRTANIERLLSGDGLHRHLGKLRPQPTAELNDS